MRSLRPAEVSWRPAGFSSASFKSRSSPSTPGGGASPARRTFERQRRRVLRLPPPRRALCWGRERQRRRDPGGCSLATSSEVC